MIKLDEPLPPDTPLRLLVKTGRGWSIVLTTTAKNQQKAADWAMLSRELDPSVQWKFEQVSGRLVRDRLWAWFSGLLP